MVIKFCVVRQCPNKILKKQVCCFMKPQVISLDVITGELLVQRRVLLDHGSLSSDLERSGARVCRVHFHAASYTYG